MSKLEQVEIIASEARAPMDKLEMPTVSVFTPPFNGYDTNALRALRNNRFAVLSAAVRTRESRRTTGYGSFRSTLTCARHTLLTCGCGLYPRSRQ
jgi:hypothetical protein